MSTTATAIPSAANEWCRCGYRRSAHAEQGDTVLCPIQEYTNILGRTITTTEHDRYFKRSEGFNS